MAYDTTMALTGAKDLEATLLRLGKAGEKIGKKALRAGAKVVAAEVRAKAASVVGGEMGNLIAQYIVVRAWKSRYQPRHGYGFQVYISEKGNEHFVVTSKDGRRAYIPNAIEYGHAAPGRAGGWKWVAAKPFMRNAFLSKVEQAANTTAKEAWKGIKATVKKR